MAIEFHDDIDLIGGATINGIRLKAGAPPATPVSGDIALVNGAISGYNGTAWEELGNDAPTTRASLGATGKFAATIGDGTATVFNVGHGLATKDVLVAVRRVSDGSQVFANEATPDVNTVRLTFKTAPASGAYRVVVVA